MALNSSIVIVDTVATADQYNNLRKDVIVKAGEYAVTTGSANAYILAIDTQYVAYTSGDTFVFKTNFANTGSATLNVNSLGAKTMKDVEGNTLATGSILNGVILRCQYDGTDIIVLSGLFATETNKGDIELATSAEALTGTDTSRAMTPSTTKDSIKDSISTPTTGLSAGTNYQASVSGFVNAYGTNGAGACTITGFVGSSDPAGTQIAKDSDNLGVGASLCFPVKKGYWYRVDAAVGTSATIIFTPNA